MQRDTAYINKLIKKKDHERSMEYHLENIKNVKPLTRPPDGLDISLNNRKKQYQNQIRFTEIQRENRILLQKISSIMNKTKRGGSSFGGDNRNKSLNSTFRKRQFQDIQLQNARFLKRLQQKRPNINTQKLNKDWQKQKNVMKIMSNYPFILTERPKQKRGSMSQMDKKQAIYTEPIEMVRVRVISGISFLITVQLSLKMLKITADCKERKQMKVIQIQRGQAIQFIQEQCHSKLQQIFNHLRYDKQQSILYLVGNQVQLQQLLAKQRKTYGIKNNKPTLQQKQGQGEEQSRQGQIIQENPEKFIVPEVQKEQYKQNQHQEQDHNQSDKQNPKQEGHAGDK